MRCAAKTSSSAVQRCRRGARSGATSSTYWLTSPHALSPETTSEVKSSLKTSRMTRTVRSGSPCRSAGAPPLPAFLAPADSALALIWSQILVSRSTSARSSSSRGALGGGAHDDAGVVGHDLLEDLLEAGPLGVGQLAGDAGHRALGHVDQVAAGQGDLRGEPGALVADRVLGDLHQHGVAGAQRVLDAAGLAALEPGGVPVDLAGVEHGVAALADVDERRLHRRQHVLHPAEVDVAGHRGRGLARDVVLDEHAVLEHADLGAVATAAHDHDALDALAAGEELGLGDDRAATTGLAALAATLLLGLEAGRALDRGRLVALRARLAHPGRGAGRVLVLAVTGATAAAAAPTAAGAALALVTLVLGTGAPGLVGGVAGRLGCRAGLVVVGLAAAAASAATATAAAARATLALVGGAVVGPAVALGGAGLVAGVGRRRVASAASAAVGGLDGSGHARVRPERPPRLRRPRGRRAVCGLGVDRGAGIGVLVGARGGLLLGDPLGGGLGGGGGPAAARRDRLGGLEEQAEARHARGPPRRLLRSSLEGLVLDDLGDGLGRRLLGGLLDLGLRRGDGLVDRGGLPGPLGRGLGRRLRRHLLGGPLAGRLLRRRPARTPRPARRPRQSGPRRPGPHRRWGQRQPVRRRGRRPSWSRGGASASREPVRSHPLR